MSADWIEEGPAEGRRARFESLNPKPTRGPQVRPPWWFCTGWWSPWCVLEALTRCQVRWICERHEKAITREADSMHGTVITDEEMQRLTFLGDATLASGSPWVQVPVPTTMTATSATFVWQSNSNWDLP